METSENTRPTPEQLADGKILLSLKEEYLKDGSDQNLFQLICCLRDSTVCVPMQVELSEEDKARIQKNLDDGIDDVSISEDTKFYPIMLTNNNGDQAFPVFSNEGEMGDNYQNDDCGVYEIPFLECINFTKNLENCSTIVLDAFTKPFVINTELADVIAQIKYKDEAE